MLDLNFKAVVANIIRGDNLREKQALQKNLTLLVKNISFQLFSSTC